jgi:hypothetical protein
MRKFAAILAIIAAMSFVEVADARLLHGGILSRGRAGCSGAVQMRAPVVQVTRVRERTVFRGRARASCGAAVQMIPAVSSSCGGAGLQQAEKIAPKKK